MLRVAGGIYTFNSRHSLLLRYTLPGRWQSASAAVPSKLAGAERKDVATSSGTSREGAGPGAAPGAGPGAWVGRGGELDSGGPQAAREDAYLFRFSNGSLFRVGADLRTCWCGAAPISSGGCICYHRSSVFLFLVTSPGQTPANTSCRVYEYDSVSKSVDSLGLEFRASPHSAYSVAGRCILVYVGLDHAGRFLGFTEILARGPRRDLAEVDVGRVDLDRLHLTFALDDRYVVAFFSQEYREYVLVYDGLLKNCVRSRTTLHGSVFSDTCALAWKETGRVIMRTGWFDLPREVCSVVYRTSDPVLSVAESAGALTGGAEGLSGPGETRARPAEPYLVTRRRERVLGVDPQSRLLSGYQGIYESADLLEESAEPRGATSAVSAILDSAAGRVIRGAAGESFSRAAAAGTSTGPSDAPSANAGGIADGADGVESAATLGFPRTSSGVSLGPLRPVAGGKEEPVEILVGSGSESSQDDLQRPTEPQVAHTMHPVGSAGLTQLRSENSRSAPRPASPALARDLLASPVTPSPMPRVDAFRAAGAPTFQYTVSTKYSDCFTGHAPMLPKEVRESLSQPRPPRSGVSLMPDGFPSPATVPLLPFAGRAASARAAGSRTERLERCDRSGRPDRAERDARVEIEPDQSGNAGDAGDTGLAEPPTPLSRDDIVRRPWSCLSQLREEPSAAGEATTLSRKEKARRYLDYLERIDVAAEFGLRDQAASRDRQRIERLEGLVQDLDAKIQQLVQQNMDLSQENVDLKARLLCADERVRELEGQVLTVRKASMTQDIRIRKLEAGAGIEHAHDIIKLD